MQQNSFGSEKKAAGSDYHAWMASHLITPEGIAAAEADEFDAFLTIRSKTIGDHVSALANW
jgi:hypothetical protein